LLFRSAEFSDLQGDDAAAFGRLGIRTVYDLRTQAERAKQPNQLPAGTGRCGIPARLLRLQDGDPLGELIPDRLRAGEIGQPARVIAVPIQLRVPVHCVNPDQPSPSASRGLSPLSRSWGSLAGQPCDWSSPLRDQIPPAAVLSRSSAQH
jgi:hypothetical protein